MARIMAEAEVVGILAGDAIESFVWCDMAEIDNRMSQNIFNESAIHFLQSFTNTQNRTKHINIV